MKHFFNIFYHLLEKDETFNLNPFADRHIGPDWLKRPFVSDDQSIQEENISIWSEFLTPQVLFARLPGGEDLRMAIYLPNGVSRQFGFAQAIPSPYHPQETQLLDVKASSIEELLSFQKDNAVRKTKTSSVNPRPKRASSRLIGKRKCYTNESQRQTKKKLDTPVDVSSNSDDGNTKDTSSATASKDKQGEPVTSPNKDEENNKNPSTEKGISQGCQTPSPMPQTKNLAIVRPDPTPSTTKVKDQNSTVSFSKTAKQLTPFVVVELITSIVVVDDLLSDLEVLSEAYACSMDANKEIVIKTSPTTQVHSQINQSPANTTFDMSTLHDFGKKL
ncbi:hypothetical protein PIB30_035197 [Stylosanthes scabra]|uniref:Uncharacterized protein n=1 Tax=Stylosanthes scabra TaxID=79078 RepID=A0ABU6QDJ6_9FABA|nr:hypothetical protein [Stylosanthes scabra]